MNSDYSGAVEDIEVGRYGLRTFAYSPTQTGGGPVIYHANGYMHLAVTPVSDTKLRPVFAGHVPDCWQDGTCTAECITTARHSAVDIAIPGAMFFGTPGFNKPSEHEIPNENCECGVYAALTLDHLMNQYPEPTRNIVAVIAAEGRTLIGDKGFRTQYARVVAYWCHKDLRSACREQFKDAGHFKRRSVMLREFGFPEPLPPPPTIITDWGGHLVATLQNKFYSHEEND